MEQSPPSQMPLKVLHLEIVCSGESRLKTTLSSREPILRGTVQPYEEAHVSLEGVTRHSQQMLATLNKANHNGRLSPELLQSLKESGQLLRDELLTLSLKDRLNQSDAHYLIISIDEQLVHIPWEMLHDGQQFLCRQFVVGRLVRTRRQLRGSSEFAKQGPLRMLVLADLDGSLKAARKEGTGIRDLIESVSGDIRVMMRRTNVNSEFLRTKIRGYDWVHFAGHADYDSDCQRKRGWRLTDGWLTAAEVSKMSGTGAMPKMIFANACQSARTEPLPLDDAGLKKRFNLVNAFLLSGTQHYVGTSWEIPDEPARQFALEFYGGLTEGLSVGCAMANAREKLIHSHGQEQVIWASYVLYGDPTHRYVTNGTVRREVLSTEITPDPQAMPTVSVTRAADTVDTGAGPPADQRYGKKIVMVMAILATLAAICTMAVMGYYPTRGSNDVQQQATAAYRAGDFQKVLEICPPPSTGDTPMVQCLLLRAKVKFVQGDLDDAGMLYGTVSESSRSTAMASAEALVGLGRIASIRGEQKLAMAYYQQAAKIAPKRKDPLLSMAIIQDRMGNDQEAMDLLDAAKRLAAPEDRSIDAVHRSWSARQALIHDKERLTLINHLIDDLATAPPDAAKALDSGPPEPGPIPVWLMAIEASGYSLQEGVPEILTTMIERHLQEDAAIRPVDRHFMERTLSELKIGASELSDQATRLNLGQLQAVRLMISGRIVFQGPETQVSLRCIDTETSRVAAIVVASFERHFSLSEIARQVTGQLIQKIDQAYP